MIHEEFSCDNLENLENRILSEEEIKLHMKNCNLCKMGRKLEKVLNIESNPLPVKPLDDILKRKYINKIIELSKENPEKEKVIPFYFRKPVYISFLIAGMVIVLSIYFMKNRKEDKVIDNTGKYLMAWGDIKTKTKFSMKNNIKTGEKIVVKNGGALVYFPNGIYVIASKNTEFSIKNVNNKVVEIFLEKGEILSSVTRKKNDPGFKIGTKHGNMVITGTVFKVNSNKQYSKLSVLEGVVKVNSINKTISVGALNCLIIGENNPKKLLDSEIGMMSKNLQIINYMKGKNLVNIDTVPYSGKLFVNNLKIGEAPFKGYLSNPNISINLNGYHEINKNITIALNKMNNYVFHLEKMKTEVIVKDVNNTISGVQNIKIENTGKLIKPHEDEVKTIKKIKKIKKTNIVNNENPKVIEHKIVSSDKIKKLTPNELLLKAQKLKFHKKYKQSAISYLQLLKLYPNSAQSQASMVSLGGIYLENLNNAKLSLVYYNLYIKNNKNGLLYQEALWGKINCLHVLKKFKFEKIELKRFIKKYPSAIQLNRAKSRLKTLKY
jgi:FecR protein